MDNTELANNITAAIRDPENTANLSINTATLKTASGDITVNVLGWLTEQMHLCPIAIFCDEEVFQALRFDSE